MSMEKLPTLSILKRIESKYDNNTNEMNHFLQQQASGERPDPAAFVKLIERQATLQQVASAQLKLHEKTLRNAINSAR